MCKKEREKAILFELVCCENNRGEIVEVCKSLIILDESDVIRYSRRGYIISVVLTTDKLIGVDRFIKARARERERDTHLKNRTEYGSLFPPPHTYTHICIHTRIRRKRDATHRRTDN
jgi:hypothetical protein